MIIAVIFMNNQIYKSLHDMSKYIQIIHSAKSRIELLQSMPILFESHRQWVFALIQANEKMVYMARVKMYGFNLSN